MYKLILARGGEKGVNTNPLNLFYRDRAWVISGDDVDLALMQECGQLFVGKHCLRNFVRINTREVSPFISYALLQEDPLGYVRSINSI